MLYPESSTLYYRQLTLPISGAVGAETPRRGSRSPNLPLLVLLLNTGDNNNNNNNNNMQNKSLSSTEKTWSGGSFVISAQTRSPSAIIRAEVSK